MNLDEWGLPLSNHKPTLYREPRPTVPPEEHPSISRDAPNSPSSPPPWVNILADAQSPLSRALRRYAQHPQESSKVRSRDRPYKKSRSPDHQIRYLGKVLDLASIPSPPRNQAKSPESLVPPSIQLGASPAILRSGRPSPRRAKSANRSKSPVVKDLSDSETFRGFLRKETQSAQKQPPQPPKSDTPPLKSAPGLSLPAAMARSINTPPESRDPVPASSTKSKRIPSRRRTPHRTRVYREQKEDEGTEQSEPRRRSPGPTTWRAHVLFESQLREGRPELLELPSYDVAEPPRTEDKKPRPPTSARRRATTSTKSRPRSVSPNRLKREQTWRKVYNDPAILSSTAPSTKRPPPSPPVVHAVLSPPSPSSSTSSTPTTPPDPTQRALDFFSPSSPTKKHSSSSSSSSSSSPTKKDTSPTKKDSYTTPQKSPSKPPRRPNSIADTSRPPAPPAPPTAVRSAAASSPPRNVTALDSLAAAAIVAERFRRMRSHSSISSQTPPPPPLPAQTPKTVQRGKGLALPSSASSSEDAHSRAQSAPQQPRTPTPSLEELLTIGRYSKRVQSKSQRPSPVLK